jgi:hypothetical protein
VDTLTDPTLKKSLQKILEKRRSSVCLVKSSASGLKVLNDDGIFSAIAEETSDLDLDQALVEKSHSKSTVASLRSNKIGSVTQKLNLSSRRDQQVFSEWDTKSVYSYQSNYRLNNFHRNSKSARSVSSTCRSVRTTKTFSQFANKNIPKVETEEMRIIKPLSSKSYRPCLTASSGGKRRSKTACSRPETSKEKSHYLTTRKDGVIRDFILMYAKVKQDKNESERAVKEIKLARMISATPEFVVKSAIGQFLTSAFPPESKDDSNGKKEKHEDMQRAKLLKIKICMQQLASIV